MNIHITAQTNPLEWTADEIAQLEALWAKGKSAFDIAMEIPGRSRSAICGKVDRLRRVQKKQLEHRLGKNQFTPGRSLMRAPKPRKSMNRGNRADGDTGFRKSTKRQALVIPTITEAMEYDCASHGIPLIDLKANDCRFIVAGEGADALFCSQHATGTYCEHHHARCHYTPKETIGVYLKRIGQVSHSGRTGAFR
jgi:hypothetical protein